jgi:hypothetical protein
MNTEEADVIRAKRIEITDSEGKTRMILATGHGSGGPVIVLLDSAGQMRVQLFVSEDKRGARLMLADEGGNNRVLVGASGDGDVGLSLFNKNDRPHFMVVSNGNAQGAIMFMDEESNPVWGWGTPRDGAE